MGDVDPEQQPPARELAVCAQHGLRFDAAAHSGCVVCRRDGRASRAPARRRWGTIGVVVGALALLGGTYGLYRYLRVHAAPKATRESEARTLRRTPLAVAPAPVPSGLPLAGAEGKDADGYPTRYVDRVALRALLARGKRAELTAYIEELQASFEGDPSHEYWVDDAADAFASAEPELRSALDEWVAAAPNSFAPYLARGAHLVTVAYAERGGDFARDTPASSMNAMRASIGLAMKDLERALSLRPKLVAADNLEIEALRTIGGHAEIRRVFDRAIGACPTCFIPRTEYMLALTPRWGGTYTAMDAFARESIAGGTPRARFLGGFVDFERARELVDKRDYARALAAIAPACAIGDYFRFLEERASIEALRDDHAAALADYDRALALRPGSPSMQVERARAHLVLHHSEAAGVDLLAALRVQPTSSEARGLHPAVVQSLVHDGWEAHKAGRRDEALRMYDLASDLDPTNAEVHWRRGVVAAGESPGAEADSVEALEQAARDNPDDFAVHRRLDNALVKAKRLDRVVAMWTEYIARHPNDGAAYMERGGAYSQMQKTSEARADAAKACALGLQTGCAIAKRLGG